MKECPTCRRCFPDEINHCPQDGDATLPSLLGEPILDARYQLEQRLGQGGMGVVFHARHIFLKTQHAIKIILPDLVGNDPMLVTRFRQEALAAAAIRHQNIIAVTDFGVVRGTMPFLVMEFVKGKSLQELMAEEGAMPVARAFELICPAAAGVAAAHRQNIVHRDLKPLNIMIQEGMPASEGLKILDFGLAKIKSGELLGSFVQAKTTGLMGSPFYMAPEQWSDEEPDARADIYSLGVILYQMLAGDVPFKGSSIPSIMKKHLTMPPPTFDSVGVKVPPQIEAVVRHALEKEPAARTPSVEALITELKDAVAQLSADETVAPTTQEIDPNRTIMEPGPGASTGSITRVGGFETKFDPHLGPISSSALDHVSATGEAFRREQEEKERFAREQLARDADARRMAEEEAARKRAEEKEERLRKEREEREEREEQGRQREQLERVTRQAEELEEKIARLTTIIPQTTAVIDPHSGQVHGATMATSPVGNNSYPGGQASAMFPQTFPGAQQKRKRSPILLAGIVLVVLFLGVGSVAFYLYWKAHTAVAGDEPGKRPSPTTPPVFKTEFVEIPGGTFQMGRNDGPPQERPEHTVTVKTFMLAKTEVTNAEYEEFVLDTNHAPPSNWLRGRPLAGQEHWPVEGVSATDAEAYATWRSKKDSVNYRLPAEEEWEYAARSGGEFKLYPWGNEWKENLAVVEAATPKAVGSYPEGENKWGVLDLIGNVWEWTSTKASLYPGNNAQIPSAMKDWVVARGGSYASDPNDKQIPISATYRDWYDPSLRHAAYGFRLASSAP
jgi:formylglycine-generating enzyme required for sulfatase activity/serine/threonine protein kinase